MNDLLKELVQRSIRSGLIAEDDSIWACNVLLDAMHMDAPDPELTAETDSLSLQQLLDLLTEDAVRRGVCGPGPEARDLFDTRLMGVLTPRPAEVRETFQKLYEAAPTAATEWFYAFSGNTNYIRKDRVARDRRWTYDSPSYGTLELSINLSKPEKDPKEIAAARTAAKQAWPACQLCRENEGYAGRVGHPARLNHRVIPFRLCGEDWAFQYSPYVYYNEHCIVFNQQHVPMAITHRTFDRLLAFTEKMPHYFIGSNADLPIVGGSILTHDHFQGGRHAFPMEKAEVEIPLSFPDYPEITGGIVRWPLSVLRLTGPEQGQLSLLAGRILDAWRGWSDPEVCIFAETDGQPHNTITPIARRRGGSYELDLVLRNNLTTEEHPMGLYHPHAELHHIKKENIGLIEVMGLAVLPARLEKELKAVENALVTGADLRQDPLTEKHALWAEQLRSRYHFTADNAEQILLTETGRVFEQVLTDCGVYKCTEDGRRAFLRFLASTGAEKG